MALCGRICVTTSNVVSNIKFSTTSFFCNKWRKQQGLEGNPRQFSPLTNLPDYSFVDGRPMILSSTQMKKIQYQQDVCKRIVELTNEIDVGLQNYYDKIEKQKKEKESIIRNKLKAKGVNLLNKKKPEG